jgi:hypothetical protein
MVSWCYHGTYPNPDRRLVAQLGGDHLLGFVNEGDERFRGLARVRGVRAEPGLFLREREEEEEERNCR